MKIIGITGNMGSGKSYLSKMFYHEKDIPVFYFDIETKKVLCNDDFVIKEMKELFGDDIYKEDGEIDSKKLADIVFTDNEALLKVERLVRGPLMEKFYRVIYLTKKHVSPPYMLAESATMTKTGLYKLMDEIILVDAPMKERLKKLKDERGVSNEDALRRINLQDDIATQICIFQNKDVNFNIFSNDYTEKSVQEYIEEFHNATMRQIEMENGA